ncbi:MAG: hypothetical protein HDQ88_00825, partial [Clostridia bacterium]|nr:hypothetical protein [Clostridia bacterium]
MKNLKPLYVKARFGGPEDAKIYAEGVKILLEESPVDFLRNLPSILVSNVGCDSCLSFIERYGLSVEAYKIFSEEVDKVLESKQGKNKDTSKQETVKQKVQEYEDDYLDSIEMYEYYTCTNTTFDDVEYLETYYGVNERGIPNNRLVIGMLDKYGEVAIPDLLIKAHSINENALNELCNVIFERYMSDEKIMQFCYESLRQLSPENMNVSDFYFQTAERRVKEVVENVEKVRDEYIMLGESGEDVYLEFGPFEQNAISDYMDVAEYKQITHPTDERSSLMEKVLEIQLVLEEYAAYTEEWMDNPHHQKTGEAPNYLMADHDLDLGELPAKKKKDEKEEEEEEEPKKHLDDFKRTSTDDDLDDIDDKTDDVEDDAVGVNDLEDVKPKDVTPPAPSGNVNNYYYYNYTNSNNKISNSHNKDSHNRDSHDRDSHDRDSHAIDARQSKRSDKSLHSNMRSDDRSVKYSNREDSSSSYSNRTSSSRDDHSVRDDHSSRKDDHSQYKRASAKKRDAEIEESVAIFEAGIRDTKEWKGECRAFYSLFKQDLNKLGDIKDPEPNIIIVIDGVKMSFSTSLAKEKDKENVLKLYAQVPTSIHQYNVNKAKFEKDTIGIGKAIVKYVSDHVKGVKKTEKPSAIIRRFKIKPRYFTFALYGNIILTFSSNIKGSEIFAVHVSPQMKCKGSALDDIKVEAYSDDFDVSLDIFEEDVEYISEQVIMEYVEEIQYLCEGASDAECKKFINDCKKIGIIVGQSYGDMAGEMHRTTTVAHRAKNDKSLFPKIAKFIKQYRRKDDFKEDMAPKHHTGTVFDFILRMDRAGGPRDYLNRLARARQPFVLTNDKRTVEFLNACNRAGINAGRNFGTGDQDKPHVKNALRVLKKHPEKAKKSMKIIEGYMKGKNKASFGKIMDQNLISHNRLLFGFLDRMLKKGGLEKYGKKIGVKMESLEFDSDFDPIFEDGDDEKKDEGKKGGNFKSGWDKFKKGVVDVVKKTLGFLHLKKLLSALEKFDEPAAIDNKIVLTYVGTNIPIELKGEGVQEAFDLGFSFNTTDDIDWLLENGWTLSDNLDGFFLEDGDEKKALNEQELMAVLEDLSKKHNDVKWLFIKPEAAEDVKQAIGPASCLKINKKTLERLKNN